MAENYEYSINKNNQSKKNAMTQSSNQTIIKENDAESRTMNHESNRKLRRLADSLPDTTSQRNGDPKSQTFSSNNNRQNGRDNGNGRDRSPGSRVRKDVVESLTDTIKSRKLTSLEMLSLVQSLGIEPMHVKRRSRDGVSEVDYDVAFGPAQFLVTRLLVAAQRINQYRKMFFDGAKYSQEDLDFLPLINASDYDRFGNPVTPQILTPAYENIEQVISQVNSRISQKYQERNAGKQPNNAPEGKQTQAKSRPGQKANPKAPAQAKAAPAVAIENIPVIPDESAADVLESSETGCSLPLVAAKQEEARA